MWLLPSILCTSFCRCSFIVLPCAPPSGIYFPNTHRISKGAVFLVSLIKQLHSDQIFFGPLLHPKSTIELTWMVSPPMSGIICVRQIYGGLNRVPLHCITKEDNVHAGHDVRADAEANPNIKGTRRDAILL